MRLKKILGFGSVVLVAVTVVLAISDLPSVRIFVRWSLLLAASALAAVAALIEYRDPKRSTKHLLAMTSLLAVLAFILEGTPKTSRQQVLDSASQLSSWHLAANAKTIDTLKIIGDRQLVNSKAIVPAQQVEDEILSLNERIDVAQKVASNMAESYYLKGKLEWNLERLEDSARSLRAAIQLRPRESRYYIGLCSTMRQLGPPTEAIAVCKTAVKLDGESGEAWNNLGNSLGAVKLYADAKAAYEMATRLLPNNARPWSNLAIIYWREDDHESALRCIQRALEIDPQFENALLLKGSILRETGRAEEAVDVYRRAIDLNPDDPQMWNNLGNALASLKKYNEAFAAYQQALLLDEKYADCYFNYGYYLNVVGRYQDSPIYLRKVIELEPKDIDAYVEIIKAYRATGKEEQVQAILQDALMAGVAVKDFGEALAADGLMDLSAKVLGKAEDQIQQPEARKPKKSIF